MSSAKCIRANYEMNKVLTQFFSMNRPDNGLYFDLIRPYEFMPNICQSLGSNCIE